MLTGILHTIKSLGFQGLVAGIVISAAIPSPALAGPPSGAVIFSYQRIDEDLYPSSSISSEQFAENIHELIEGGYVIKPLGDIVAALKSGTPLPEKTVAITFDGAYESALEKAFPLLLANNIPFTVFFSPDQADGKNSQYMDWADIHRLRKIDKVTLGLHPAAYIRLTDEPEEEIRRHINKSLTRYREEIRSEPDFFAYPFGEYTKTYRQIISESGFSAAFGQQSGAAYAGSDFYVLPRFAMTDSHGNHDRFQMAASSLPLPVTDITPENPHLDGTSIPAIGFSVDRTLSEALPSLSCFISEQGKAKLQLIGENRIELRLDQGFQSDRVRINCTMPAEKDIATGEPRWRWFGMLLSVAGEGPDDETMSADDTEPAAGPLPN